MEVPRYFCPRCMALKPNPPVDEAGFKCVMCQLELTPDPRSFRADESQKWLDKEGYAIDWEDLDEHVGRLKRRAERLATSKVPIRELFRTLDAARYFVHIVTYSFDVAMLGALRFLSHRVPVRVVLGNPAEWAAKAIKDGSAETPNLLVRIPALANPQLRPHSKVVVVDGLVAFKGAANLSTTGWRNAGENMDFVEAETDVSEVVKLHNRTFSPAWRLTSEVPDKLVMDDQSAPVWARFAGEAPPWDYLKD